MACGGLCHASPLGQCGWSSFAEDSSSRLVGDSCSWVTEALALDKEMSFAAGGEAEDVASSLPSPSYLSGGGGGIGAVREAGDMDVSSPPNLSAEGVEKSTMASGQALTTSPSFPILSLSILQGTGLPTSSLLIG